MKVYRDGKLDIIATIKASTPRPVQTLRYHHEDIERRKRAQRDARLAHFN